MEEQSANPQNAMREDAFEVVMRGYSKRQVDDFVLQAQRHIHELDQRLSVALDEAERARHEAVETKQRSVIRPAHEEVSERLTQILKLANEEADRERAQAEEEIAQLRAHTIEETQALRLQMLRDAETLRTQAKQETDALRQRVHSETEAIRVQSQQQAVGMLEQARQESDRLLAQARDTSHREVAAAQSEATRLETTARAEADRLLTASNQRAGELLGDAERRTAAINSLLGNRLHALTSAHGDVLGRLGDVRDILTAVLSQEASMGAFELPAPLNVNGTPMNGTPMNGMPMNGSAAAGDQARIGEQRAEQTPRRRQEAGPITLPQRRPDGQDAERAAAPHEARHQGPRLPEARLPKPQNTAAEELAPVPEESDLFTPQRTVRERAKPATRPRSTTKRSESQAPADQAPAEEPVLDVTTSADATSR